MKQLTRKLDSMNILVVGLARSGTAAARLAEYAGASVTVTDTRSEAELRDNLLGLSIRTRVKLGKMTADDCRNFNLVVLSPGVPPAQDWIRETEACGIRIAGEVEFASSLLDGKILGITGTNGKTTTTMLTGELLKASGMDAEVTGNVGTPLSESVLKAAKSGRRPVFVTELSSFQLEKTSGLSCRIAVFLNCSPDHLDRYPDFNAYRNTKLRIFRNQGKDDFAIVNGDDPFLLEESSRFPSIQFPFSLSGPLEQGVFLDGDCFWASWKGAKTRLISTSDIRLRGSHNQENAAAALAASFLAGTSPEIMPGAFRKFKGLEHRLEFVTRLDGVDYFNDSKSTTSQSTRRALDSFPGTVVLIMGGFDKGENFACLRETVSGKVSHLILMGDTAEKIETQLQGSADISRATSIEEALLTAARLAHPRDTVLFSPACASFDMFKNFEHRGEVFKSLVLSLESARSGYAPEVNSA